MNIAWPSTLPPPTVEGYGLSPQEAVLRTDMESGPARQRRRFRQTPTRISVRWMFTEFEFALFEAWYKYHADEGGQWFEITLLGGLGLGLDGRDFIVPLSAVEDVAVKPTIPVFAGLNGLYILYAGTDDTHGNHNHSHSKKRVVIKDKIDKHNRCHTRRR